MEFDKIHLSRFKEVIINEYFSLHIFINDIYHFKIKQPNDLCLNKKATIINTLLFRKDSYDFQLSGQFRVLNVHKKGMILLKISNK